MCPRGLRVKTSPFFFFYFLLFFGIPPALILLLVEICIETCMKLINLSLFQHESIVYIGCRNAQSTLDVEMPSWKVKKYLGQTGYLGSCKH